jgi:hypothetical protein
MGLRGRETGYQPAVRKPLNLNRVMPAEEREPTPGLSFHPAYPNVTMRRRQ